MGGLGAALGARPQLVDTGPGGRHPIPQVLCCFCDGAAKGPPRAASDDWANSLGDTPPFDARPLCRLLASSPRLHVSASCLSWSVRVCPCVSVSVRRKCACLPRTLFKFAIPLAALPQPLPLPSFRTARLFSPTSVIFPSLSSLPCCRLPSRPISIPFL